MERVGRGLGVRRGARRSARGLPRVLLLATLAILAIAMRSVGYGIQSNGNGGGVSVIETAKGSEVLRLGFPITSKPVTGRASGMNHFLLNRRQPVWPVRSSSGFDRARELGRPQIALYATDQKTDSAGQIPDVDVGLGIEMPKEMVQQSGTVRTSARHCRHVITNFEDYPNWTGAVSRATILETDDKGRGKIVRYDAGALGLTASYTLSYTYDDKHTLAWESVAGSIKKIVGSYNLKEIDEKNVEITYTLGVDLGFYLPAYLKRALTKLVINVALRELKRYSEKTYNPEKEAEELLLETSPAVSPQPQNFDDPVPVSSSEGEEDSASSPPTELPIRVRKRDRFWKFVRKLRNILLLRFNRE